MGLAGLSGGHSGRTGRCTHVSTSWGQGSLQGAQSSQSRGAPRLAQCAAVAALKVFAEEWVLRVQLCAEPHRRSQAWGARRQGGVHVLRDARGRAWTGRGGRRRARCGPTRPLHTTAPGGKAAGKQHLIVSECQGTRYKEETDSNSINYEGDLHPHHVNQGLFTHVNRGTGLGQ